MKTKILHFVVVFCFLGCLSVKTVAINYTITFTGTGASYEVSSVIVQNLTQGTSVTVPAGNVVNLLDATNAVEQVSSNNEMIRVYPASMNGKSIVSFYAKQAGITQLNVFSIDGRKVAGISTGLQAGSNRFELSLPKGVFVIQVTGNEYAYSAKLLNQTETQGKPEIVYADIEKPAVFSPQKTKSSALNVTTMSYTAGDRLLYKGISGIPEIPAHFGNFSTIVTDVPTGDKTTNFSFAACTDADNNNYTVVTIGTQTWMAENLKTTRYNDNTAIPLVTDNTAWTNTPGYCWYNNDAATYKNTYGALYNWDALKTGKLAPTGWHVPTDAEWTTLQSYLTASGYNYDGSTSGNHFAKSLAATTNWTTYTDAGTIGNDLTKNNSTGFSAFPSGYRNSNGFDFSSTSSSWWSTTIDDTGGILHRNLSYLKSDLNRVSNSLGNGYSVRCIQDGPPPLVIITNPDVPIAIEYPILTTTAITSFCGDINNNTAVGGGNITQGATITARGVCWSTSANPTITNSKTIDGTGRGTFTSTLTGLTAQTYYVRAYATTPTGTTYGNQVVFSIEVVSSRIANPNPGDE